MDQIGKILILIGAIFLGAGCETISPPRTEMPQKTIRIAVLRDAPYVIVTMRGVYQVIDPATHQTIEEGRRLRQTKITAYPDGIQVGQKRYPQQRIRLVPAKDIGLRTHRREKRYRGSVDIIRDTENRLLVVNRLGIEDYVKGILYHEASHRWPMEALKAQAVAARTYALYQMEANAKEEYDVTSDIYSQVYGGRSAERYRTNLAVQKTYGQVMRFKGKIIPAYYHSTCGGLTEDVRKLWEHDDLAPLKGVRCGFCTHSPHYRWKKNYRSKDIQDALNTQGRELGLIKDIHVLSRDKSGRIEDLKVTTRDGKSHVIKGKDLREIVGPNTIKSNNYRIVMKGYYFDLIGKGWGHGVGMCQWGAHGMARERHTHETILRHYYPGVKLRKL